MIAGVVESEGAVAFRPFGTIADIARNYGLAGFYT